MNDYVVVVVVGLIALLVGYIFHTIRDAFLKNALLKEANLLRSQIANARKLLGDFEEEPENMFAGAMGNLGIGGLLSNLNISDEMLKELGVPGWAIPIAHGFIDKMKQKGMQNGTQEQKQEHPSQL